MSLLECKCAQPLWALGIPDCHPVLRPIRRVAFETNLIASDDPADFNLLTSTLYTDARRLITPTLYQVASERPEPVFEELSGTRFFVRKTPRNFTALVAKPPAEWGINIDQLRCRSRLGVFLIDEAGVVWGRRASAIEAGPIPIDPATVSARMVFPSDTAITKYEITFDFAQGFEDFELVPVYADKGLLNYVAPIALRMEARYNQSFGSLDVFIYALYAQSAGNLYVPITGQAANIRIRDASNNVISATFNEVRPGVYTASVSLSSGVYTIDMPTPVSGFDVTTAVATITV